MPLETPHPGLEEIVLQLTETQDTLAALITEVRSTMRREFDERFAAVNLRIDILEVGSSGALEREHYHNATAIASLTQHLAKTDRYVQNMRDGLERTIHDDIADLDQRIITLEN